MKDLIDRVAAFLQASGVGTLGVTLFKHTMPTSPVACTVVYASGGLSRWESKIREYSFTILMRDTHASSLTLRVDAMHALLDDKWNVTSCLAGHVVSTFNPGPYFVDEENRVYARLVYDLVTPRRY